MHGTTRNPAKHSKRSWNSPSILDTPTLQPRRQQMLRDSLARMLMNDALKHAMIHNIHDNILLDRQAELGPPLQCCKHAERPANTPRSQGPVPQIDSLGQSLENSKYLLHWWGGHLPSMPALTSAQSQAASTSQPTRDSKHPKASLCLAGR